MVEFRNLVRVCGVDIDGNLLLGRALCEIRGVGNAMSNAIVHLSGFDSKKKLGDFSDSEVSRIESIIKNPLGNNIPTWMVNRKKDYETGRDAHKVQEDLQISQKDDIERMKTMKCYRGVRHIFGLPCRGQKTKSTHRKGRTLGVSKKRVTPAAGAAAAAAPAPTTKG